MSLAESAPSFTSIFLLPEILPDSALSNMRIDLLGIFTLNLKQPLSLEIHHDNCDQLLEELSPFIEPGTA